jgi:hypothetical protein
MKPVPNRAKGRMTIDVNAAKLKAERAELNAYSGKFKTGAIKSSAEKRNSTRADKKRNAIREDMN